MNFYFSGKVKVYQEQLQYFMDVHVFPEPVFMEDLKKKAKEEGLWNFFLPDDTYSAGLTNLE